MYTYDEIENRLLEKAIKLNVVTPEIYSEAPTERLRVVMEMAGREITTNCQKLIYGDSAETVIRQCKLESRYDLDYSTTRIETKVRYNPQYDIEYFRNNCARFTGYKPDYSDRISLVTADGEYIEWLSSAYSKSDYMMKPVDYCDSSKGTKKEIYYDYDYTNRRFSCPVPNWNNWKRVLTLIDKRHNELNNVS